MELKAWNTGRQYTTNGQRIAAILNHDNTVSFVDIDRNIDGTTTRIITSGQKFESFVMDCYDKGFYTEFTKYENYEKWSTLNKLAQQI